MRYFRAYCAGDDFRSSNIDSFEYLYEAFGKKAFLCPFRVVGARPTEANGHDAILGVSIVFAETHVDEHMVEEHIQKACCSWGISHPLLLRVEECTFDKCFILHESGYFSYNESELYGIANLFELSEFLKTPKVFSDRMLSSSLSKTPALSQAKDTRYQDSLSNELHRVYAAKKDRSNKAIELPVHYIIEGESPVQYEPPLDILLSALLAKDRLPSKHVFHFNIDGISEGAFRSRLFQAEENLIASINDSFVQSLKGNTLIVEYGKCDNGSTYDVPSYNVWTKLLSVLESGFEDIQLVFIIPPNKPDLKAKLKKRCTFPLVEIVQDQQPNAQHLGYKSSLHHLTAKANSAGLEVDKKLKTMLKERLCDRSFNDLDSLFVVWKQIKCAEMNFPQYQEIVAHELEAPQQESKTSAWQKLDELIGLEDIKEQIKDILLRFRMNKEVARLGLPVQPFSLHLAFLGSPGTGKTEVARLYGEILQEEGALREGRVISVSGSGCWNIAETFQKARGSVLFIDEAYGLLGNPDKITELIALMENHREDTVVILAGYEDSINYLLDSNPGFRSRLGFSFKFPDYSVEELLKIFELMCRRAKLVLPDAAQKTARDILSRGGRREDQGNARFVRKLFEDTIGAQQKRLARRISKKGELQKVDLQTVLPQDLGNKSLLLRGKSARQELFELIGLKEVKVLISEWLDFARVQKVRRDAGLKSSFIPLHMAFTGNPGSGKTEVARLVGRILKEENVLSVGDFFECGRQDLVGTTVGSTAPKVENLFRKARGSVIFIDEAYSLNDGCKGGFGDEAIAALIDQMEKLREEVVVIFAGYPNEINELLERNPGFKSRIRTHIAFPDYTVESLGEILELMAKKEGMQLKEGAHEKVNAILQQASKQVDFGNARFCRNLFEDALVAQSVRLATLMDDRSQKSLKHSKQKEAEGSTVASAALLEKEELMTLAAEDFKWKEPEEKKKFGF